MRKSRRERWPAQYERILQENIDLKNRFAALEAAHETLKRQYSQLEAQYTRLDGVFATVIDERNGLIKYVKSLESELELSQFCPLCGQSQI